MIPRGFGPSSFLQRVIDMTTAVKCETIDKAGWAGLRRFSGTLDPTSSKYIVPMGSFTPVMAVHVAGKIGTADGDAAYACYFDPAAKEIQFYTAAGTKKTSDPIWFELVVMGY